MTQRHPPLPHWDLSNVYPGLEAAEFLADWGKAESRLSSLEAYVAQAGVKRLESPPGDLTAAKDVLEQMLARLDELLMLLATMGAYVHSFVSTDSYDHAASKRLSELELLQVRGEKLLTRFQSWVGSLGHAALDELVGMSAQVTTHRQVLDDIATRSRFLMQTELEDLAAELQLSGGGVMWKLQGNVTSQLKVPFERNGQAEELPMTVLRNLASDPDEDTRRRAYETELQAWASIRESIAFSLNCVKGSAVTLCKWRGYEDVLHAALLQNHIDRPTLDALLGSIREYLPQFRRYLRSKAEKLGKEKLPWWDLFAPVGRANPSYSWEQARDFIQEQFSGFTPELAQFARHAFDHDWIDAQPRDGKRGGAFCMRVPGVEESRILANYDGSFDQMVTLAHELGHGYHNHCQTGLPIILRGAPMVLAETASIFCETIVFNAALDAASADEQLSILENQLLGATQVTVDISSRFLFESEVVGRRAAAELSATDFCDIMLDAQKQTYGDALDHDHLHPYMWLLKPHYYYGNLNFYNFPYAFGLLFGMGVYALYQKEGDAFVPRYHELLRSTGAGEAADLAAGFGIDIRSPAFWKGSLDLIVKQIDRYCSLSV
jgi:pepF/M3 family oligoendopeptidase